MSRLATLMATRSRVVVVPWPGNPDHKVGILALTTHEIQEAEVQARQRMDALKVGKSVFDAALLEDEVDTQILHRALVDPDDGKTPLADSAAELRQLLLPSEKVALAQLYNDHQARLNPAGAEESETALNEMMEEIRKDPSRLSSFGTATLRRLVLSMASRPVS